LIVGESEFELKMFSLEMQRKYQLVISKNYIEPILVEDTTK